MVFLVFHLLRISSESQIFQMFQWVGADCLLLKNFKMPDSGLALQKILA
jgi:hypothetical protein